MYKGICCLLFLCRIFILFFDMLIEVLVFFILFIDDFVKII